MEKYLYLTRKEWVPTWVEGGTIPIKLASSYLSDSRNGSMTPDENLIHESNVDLTKLSPFIHIPKHGSIRSLTMTDNRVFGKPLPDINDGKYIHEDGLILSFSNSLASSIATRLGKEACVVIHDIGQLKSCIDEQLGVEGKMAPCKYTDDHQRNHFLKSAEDSWQDEYRIFWSLPEEKEVIIPGGLCSEVEI